MKETCPVGGCKYYAKLVDALSQLQSPLLLAMRLYWGWHFFQAGLGKLTHIDHVVEFFTGLGIPVPLVNAYLAGTVECVGGFLLLIGLRARLVAIPLSFVMWVAYLTADHEVLMNFYTDPDKFVKAEPFLFLLTCLVVMAFGPGRYSVDGLCCWWRCRKDNAK